MFVIGVIVGAVVVLVGQALLIAYWARHDERG
jgi:hypothetical protein